jgi:hypothetical protein
MQISVNINNTINFNFSDQQSKGNDRNSSKIEEDMDMTSESSDDQDDDDDDDEENDDNEDNINQVQEPNFPTPPTSVHSQDINHA